MDEIFAGEETVLVSTPTPDNKLANNFGEWTLISKKKAKKNCKSTSKYMTISQMGKESPD